MSFNSDLYHKQKYSWEKYYKKYYLKHKKEYSKHNKIYGEKLRKQLFEILNDYDNSKIKCKKCGFNDIRALAIDHIKNDGKKDRDEHGKSKAFYKFYIKNPEIAIKKLQILCHNCNFVKHITYLKYKKYPKRRK